MIKGAKMFINSYFVSPTPDVKTHRRLAVAQKVIKF